MTRNGVASSSSLQEKVDFLNDFFQSVYSPKVEFNLSDIKFEYPKLTNFSISQTEVFDILVNDDNKKSRVPNEYPPMLFQKTAFHMSSCLHNLLKNIKRLRKIPKLWKVAAISPIHKKKDKRIMENYHPVSLLNYGLSEKIPTWFCSKEISTNEFDFVLEKNLRCT